MKKFILLITWIMGSWTFAAAAPYPFEVKISGAGKESVIFIPGLACSGDVWNETRALLEKSYSCHTLTMAGFAGVPAEGAPSFQRWEKAIADYIIQNKIHKPVIVGHSVGGGLAMALAADYPDLISKIVVVDGLPCVAALMNPSFKSNEKNDCSAMVSQITSATDAQFYQMQKGSMASMVTDVEKQELVVGWSVKSDRRTIAEIYCDFSNTDLREKISSITCPTLILLESYFANFKPAITGQFQNLKGAKLEYATKGLHFIMYDDTTWYLAQISSFVNP